MSTIKEIAQRVVLATADAYSTRRYRSWVGVAEALLKHGLTETQAEAVMLSKWTRWAADKHGGKDGTVPAKAVVDYLKTEILPGRVQQLEAEYLAEQEAEEAPAMSEKELKAEINRLKATIRKAQKESELTERNGKPALIIPYWFIHAK